MSIPITQTVLRSCAVTFAFVIAMLAAGLVRADDIQAGLWKVVTKPEVNGKTGPDQETMRCLTPDEVKNLEATFSPSSRTTNSSCETVEHEATSQRVKWRLQCKGDIDMDVAGEFVFDAPEHYTATITTRAEMLGREIQNSRAMIEAKRVGPCE